MAITKEREVSVSVGDLVGNWRPGWFRQGIVIKVTKKYIWLEDTSLGEHKPLIIKRHRAEVLMGTKYY